VLFDSGRPAAAALVLEDAGDARRRDPLEGRGAGQPLQQVLRVPLLHGQRRRRAHAGVDPLLRAVQQQPNASRTTLARPAAACRMVPSFKVLFCVFRGSNIGTTKPGVFLRHRPALFWSIQGGLEDQPRVDRLVVSIL
jgi:hypothetical protein